MLSHRLVVSIVCDSPINTRGYACCEHDVIETEPLRSVPDYVESKRMISRATSKLKGMGWDTNKSLCAGCQARMAERNRITWRPITKGWSVFLDGKAVGTIEIGADGMWRYYPKQNRKNCGDPFKTSELCLDSLMPDNTLQEQECDT